jgi:hypothetical protein
LPYVLVKLLALAPKFLILRCLAHVISGSWMALSDKDNLGGVGMNKNENKKDDENKNDKKGQSNGNGTSLINNSINDSLNRQNNNKGDEK